MTAEPPALPRRDDVLVDKGAEASKPCLSLAETRTQTAAGGLLPIGTASIIAMRILFPQPPFFWSLGEIKRKVLGGQTTNFPSSARGGVFNQNEGQLWYSILADV